MKGESKESIIDVRLVQIEVNKDRTLAVCEVVCERNSYGCKRIVVSNKQLLLYKLKTVGPINSVYNKESLIENKHICFYFVYSQRTHLKR